MSSSSEDMPDLVSSDEEPEYFEVNNDEYVKKWLKLGPRKLKAEETKMMQQVLGPFLFGFEVVAPHVWITALVDSGVLKSKERSYRTDAMDDDEWRTVEIMQAIIKRHGHTVRDSKILQDVLAMIAQIEKNSVSTDLVEPVRATDTAIQWPFFFEAWSELKSAYKNAKPFCLVFFYKIIDHHVTAYGKTGKLKSDLILDLKLGDREIIKSAKEQGNSAFKLQQFPFACDMYSRAIAQDSLTATLYGNRSQAYINAEFFREGYCDARRALALSDSSPKFYYRCAEACVHLDRLGEAMEMNLKGLERCKKNQGEFEPQLLEQKEKIAKAMKEKEKQNAEKKKPERKPTAQFLAMTATPPPEPPAPPKPKLASLEAIKEREESAAKLPEPVDPEKELAKYTALVEEGHTALQQNDNPVRACAKYQAALELCAHSPSVKCGLTESEVLALRYVCGISGVLQDAAKAIQEGLEIFKSMQKELPADTFPLLYYGLGRAHTAFYRFGDAMEPVEMGLQLIQKLKSNWPEVCWPSSDQIIEESKLPVYKRLMEELLTLSCYPPVPDATCSMHVNHDDEHVHIYFQSPTFQGYTQISCHLKCRIIFHPYCWKHYKSTVAEKASDKEILNLPCPTPNCGSSIFRIFICRPRSKTEDKDSNKEFVSSLKPEKELAGSHKAQRMQMSNPDRIAKKLARKEIRRQKRLDAWEAQLQAEQMEKEEARADDSHLLQEHGLEEQQVAIAVTEDVALTRLDKEKDDEGVKYHVAVRQKSLRQKKKKEKVKHVLNVEVNFSDNREATLLGEEDADGGDESKSSRTLNSRMSGTHLFEVPLHLHTPVHSMVGSGNADSHVSDRSIMENVYEYFSGILTEHGPLSLWDPVMQQELSELPDKAKGIISRAGGPACFFKQSLKFVVIGDIMANICDSKKAHELAKWSDASNGHDVDAGLRYPSATRPVVCTNRLKPYTSSIMPRSAEVPGVMYNRVAMPSSVSLSQNDHGSLAWSAGGSMVENSVDLEDGAGHSTFSYQNNGDSSGDFIDLMVPNQPSWLGTGMEKKGRNTLGRLNPSAPEFQPSHGGLALQVENGTRWLSDGVQLEDNSVYHSANHLTASKTEVSSGHSGAQPGGQRAQGYDTVETFPQTSIDSLDDIDDSNLPAPSLAEDPISVQDIDTIDDYVLPTGTAGEAGLVECSVSGMRAMQAAQTVEQDVTLSRRSSQSDTSLTSDISMGGLFRTSSPSSSVSSMKVGSLRDVNSPLMTRDVNSPHMMRDVNSPHTVRDVGSPFVTRDVSSPHTMRDVNSPHVMRDSTMIHFPHHSLSSSFTQDVVAVPPFHSGLAEESAGQGYNTGVSQLGFGEDFAANLNRTAASAFPKSPVPLSLSDSPPPVSASLPPSVGSSFGSFGKYSQTVGSASRCVPSDMCSVTETVMDTEDVVRHKPPMSREVSDVPSSLTVPRPLKPLAPISAVKSSSSSSVSSSSSSSAQTSLSLPSGTWGLASSPSSSSLSTRSAPYVSLSSSSLPTHTDPYVSDEWYDDSFPSSVRPDEDLTSCIKPTSLAPLRERFSSPEKSTIPSPIPLPSLSAYTSSWPTGADSWNTTAPKITGWSTPAFETGDNRDSVIAPKAMSEGERDFAEAGAQVKVDVRSVYVNTDLDVEGVLRVSHHLEEERQQLVQQLRLTIEEQRRLKMALQRSQLEKESLERETDELRQERNKAVQQMNNLETSWEEEKRLLLESVMQLNVEVKALKDRSSVSAVETRNLLQQVSVTERRLQTEELRSKTAEMEVVCLNMQLNLQLLERRKTEAAMHQHYTSMYAGRCQEKGQVPDKVREALTYWQTVMEAFNTKHTEVKRAFEEQLSEIQKGKRLADLTPVPVSPPPLPRMPDGMSMPTVNDQPSPLPHGNHPLPHAMDQHPFNAPRMPGSIPTSVNNSKSVTMTTETVANSGGTPHPPSAMNMPRPLIPQRPMMMPLRPPITPARPSAPATPPSTTKAPLRPPLPTILHPPTPTQMSAAPTRLLTVLTSQQQAGSDWHHVTGNGSASEPQMVPPRPVVDVASGPRSSFDKLVMTLQKSFPSCSRDDFSRFIQKLRQAHGGSLSGMSLEFIVTCMTQMLIAHGFRPCGNAQVSLSSASNTNNSNSAGAGGHRSLAPPPGLNPSWSVEGLEPVGGAYDVGGVDRFEEEDPCAICHDELSSALVVKLDCAHRFHDQCIRTWFKQQTTCPTCRIYAPLHDEFPLLK